MRRQKLGRNTNQRKALFRSLANSVILYEKIVTTEPKAKAVRPILEKLISKAKQGDIFSRRQVEASLANPNATRKMFDLLGPQFKDRSGGYLRITKLTSRAGDQAPMAKLEFVEEIKVPTQKIKAESAKTEKVETERKEKPKAKLEKKTKEKVKEDEN